MSAAAESCRLVVKVAPGASSDAIQGWLGGTLKLRVTAPPERGKANAATIRVLAKALGVPERTLAVARGTASPRKIIEIEGLSEAEVLRRLNCAR